MSTEKATRGLTVYLYLSCYVHQKVYCLKIRSSGMLRRVAWSKMEKEGSSKNSVTIYQATRRYIPEDRNLNIYCANLNLNLRKPTTAQLFLISNLRRVVNIVFFLFGDSPSLNFMCRRFRTLCLFHLHRSFEPNI